MPFFIYSVYMTLRYSDGEFNPAFEAMLVYSPLEYEFGMYAMGGEL